MPAKIFSHIDEYLEGAPTLKVDADGEANGYDVRVAVAVLLMKMALIDDHLDPREVAVVIKSMLNMFDTTEREIGSLMTTTELLLEATERLPELVEIINMHFNDEQKITIICDLIKVMTADEITLESEIDLSERLCSMLELDKEKLAAVLK